jgi:hypothetical protein
VENEFECPLCGVADRTRRFSKGGASLRARSVSSESSAYWLGADGATVCASSKTSSDLGRRLPFLSRYWNNGSRCSVRFSVW